MKVRRSMAIVPANEPKYLEKAPALEVDVCTIDLQDSVIRMDKAKLAARAACVAPLHAFRGWQGLLRPDL